MITASEWRDVSGTKSWEKRQYDSTGWPGILQHRDMYYALLLKSAAKSIRFVVIFVECKPRFLVRGEPKVVAVCAREWSKRCC